MINTIREQEKQLRTFIFTLIIIVLILFSAVMLMLNVGPRKLCNNWGGVYYSNGQCYITAQMDKCVYPGGEVGNKPTTYFNISVNPEDI